ncbi:agamous-like MADS-box protein AGL62 [Mercurialis annua]|uniref:agamous-like MADS-box protein AGL62 n=1 Tax=Mercurialis annua TaxID=3986 RepID=UPI00215E652E|nr:agamous-like MADS-box protein AGL62 [Mercurialis annua]
MSKRSKGRQKVDMAKMPNESSLQVTFSKRRAGLFKKASELCTLCGAEVAIVVFSPGNKAFSFGHPSVEGLVERFLTRNPPQRSPTMQLIEAHRNANVRDLNGQLTQLSSQIEFEKKRGEQLTQLRKSRRNQHWWEAPLETLTKPQINQLRSSLEQLKKNVAMQADKLLIQSAQSQQFYASSSTNPQIFPNLDPRNNNLMFDFSNMTNPHLGFNNFGYGNGLGNGFY